MRCREVEALWDEIREGKVPLREAVFSHLRACPPCQELYEQYEGVAYCLSCLSAPPPSCDLTKKIVEHIAQLRSCVRSTPISLTTIDSPIGRLYVGFKESRIAYISIDRNDSFAEIQTLIERRLRRPVVSAEPPAWLLHTLKEFFQTWQVDDRFVDLTDLTPFEQAALKKAAQIPPGEVRSYAWVAREIGKPKAARAVGQVMARNPVPVLYPCHRVVDSSGELHNYGFGIEMKARLLKLEGYQR
ncbi:MAG: methylated-DNA--[protein]-cysteine S-methyltransferase [Candidatus Eremiobacteraeota bacterium]|nr:methylated-DNA--[protein]-cysteine S-methyltransferase [Candidatus Eremiobacteraeota bacterium]